jgi:hypothetical protein
MLLIKYLKIQDTAGYRICKVRGLAREGLMQPPAPDNKNNKDQ